MPSVAPPSAGADSPVAPAAVPAGRAGYRQLLAGTEFRVIFAADIVSMLGTVVAAVTLTVLVYQRTGSAALAASVMALAFLPYLAGGVLAGAAADRLPGRRVLVACDLASAALIAAMTIPGIPVAGLLVLLFANGLIAPVYQGVRSALLPDVLPPGPGYVLGRSMMRMVAQSAQIAGYGVGGALLAIVSPRGALTVDALSYAASAVLLRAGLAARAPRAARTGETGSVARDSLAGVRRVLARGPLRRILLFGALVVACAIAPEAVAAPYAASIGQPARAAGFLLMGIPAGTVLADVIVARLLPVRLQRRIIVPAGLLVFFPLIGFAAGPRLGPAIALLVISGLGSAWAAGLDGLLIDVAPPALRSRALALQGAGLMFTQGAGFALWGIAAQFAPLTVIIPAAGVAGGVAVVTLRPRRTGPPPATQPGPVPEPGHGAGPMPGRTRAR